MDRHVILVTSVGGLSERHLFPFMSHDPIDFTRAYREAETVRAKVRGKGKAVLCAIMAPVWEFRNE